MLIVAIVIDLCIFKLLELLQPLFYGAAYVLLSLQKSKIYIRKGIVIQTMKLIHIW